MFVSFLCAWLAFALPAYSTYKALAHSPEALPKLAAYWTVVGAFVALEQSPIGLFLSWLPFYWELRSVFLLYVSLPQTQGAAYVYNHHLAPWFSKNEADFDATLASAWSNAVTFCRTRFTALLDLVWSVLNKSPSSGQSTPTGETQEPALFPLADHLMGLWTAYRPALMAAFPPKDTGDTHGDHPAN